MPGQEQAQRLLFPARRCSSSHSSIASGTTRGSVRQAQAPTCRTGRPALPPASPPAVQPSSVPAATGSSASHGFAEGIQGAGADQDSSTRRLAFLRSMRRQNSNRSRNGPSRSRNSTMPSIAPHRHPLSHPGQTTVVAVDSEHIAGAIHIRRLDLELHRAAFFDEGHHLVGIVHVRGQHGRP